MKNVKIILNEDIPNLGEEGDVKEVSPGYARNYLIPKGIVFPYTKQNIALLEQRRIAIEKRKDEKRQAAMGLKERIESLAVTIEMPAGDSGKLFGSVTNANITERLAAEGIVIERKKIEIPDHTIKNTGVYTVIIKLYDDQAAELKVEVKPVGAQKSDGNVKDKEKKKSHKNVARDKEAAVSEEPDTGAYAVKADSGGDAGELAESVPADDTAAKAPAGEAPVAETPPVDTPAVDTPAVDTPQEAVEEPEASAEPEVDSQPEAESEQSKE